MIREKLANYCHLTGNKRRQLLSLNFNNNKLHRKTEFTDIISDYRTQSHSFGSTKVFQNTDTKIILK